MVAPNVPAWSFDIVYALSADRLPYFHKSGAGAQPTPLGILPQTELAKALLKLGADSAAPHRVHILDPVPALNISEWVRDLGLPSAARLNIVDHEEANQHRVLNMCAHQVACAAVFKDVERTTNVPFDLIVAAREDIQLFKPVHLAALHNMRSRDHSGEPATCCTRVVTRGMGSVCV